MASFVMEFPWTLNLPITFLVQCTLHCADILENSFTGCALSFPRPLLAYLSTVLSSKAPWQVHLSCPLSSLSNIFHSFPFVALPLPVYVGRSLRLCPELYLLTYIRSQLFLNLNLSCCCLVTKSCQSLCDPMDCSPPGSSVHGILQARILEWVAISFSRGSSRPKDQTQVSLIAGRFFTIQPPGKPSLSLNNHISANSLQTSLCQFLA